MYRSKDFDNIMLSIDNIKDKAAERYKTNYEPTLTENFNVCYEIKKYIIEKNRIIYVKSTTRIILFFAFSSL